MQQINTLSRIITRIEPDQPLTSEDLFNLISWHEFSRNGDNAFIHGARFAVHRIVENGYLPGELLSQLKGLFEECQDKLYLDSNGYRTDTRSENKQNPLCENDVTY